MVEKSFIVVEGPIGVGKTSLTHRLADHLQAETVLESVDENPFLSKFYRHPEQYALSTQLYFLLRRAEQMSALKQEDLFSRTRVADYLMSKDKLFASVTLNEEEFKIYEQVYERMAVSVPPPDLVVYLQAPVEILMQRIAHRGRKFERTMERQYLLRLMDAYTEFFFHYSEAPLLIVNAAEIDWVNNNKDFDQMLEQIMSMETGRQYFNAPSIKS
ncbi:MAG TPA: deoxynucleoside kinase [Gammaproteobacteria bacterium]|nr:deoxynucleoside kinase [Gammaproteobacteria bacterium]